jgi:hypothetical protein
MHKNRRPENRQFGSTSARAGVLGLISITLGLVFFPLAGCKNSTTPDSFEINIVAHNESGAAVDIFVDGVFRISVEAGSEGSISKVSNGSHQLVVKQQGTEILFTSQQIDITDKSDYAWVIYGPSSIKITNNYGETLQIYSGDAYMGDLIDQDTQSVSEVPFGDHLLSATRLSDMKVAAFVVITVNEVKEYTWIINP